MMPPRSLKSMMNKLEVFFFLFFSQCFGCYCDDDSKHHFVRDTIVDCSRISIVYMEPYDYCCKGLKVGLVLPGKDCKSLGVKDSIFPISFDSVKTAKSKDFNEDCFYLNGKIQEKIVLSKDGSQKIKEILVYDTTMQDSFFRIYLWSKYIDNKLIKRESRIDTVIIKK